MSATADTEPTQRMIPLPGRGGAMAALEFGPTDRPVDIVFSHANGFNGRTYRTILAPLASDLRILALDLRGHGASTRRPEDLSRAAFVEDVAAVIRNASPDGPVTLVGQSMGGHTAILAAAALPELVEPGVEDIS